MIRTIKGIDFVNECDGWGATEPVEGGRGNSSAVVVHTSNGGRSWELQKTGLRNTTLNRVEFVDRTHGWVIGEPMEEEGNSPPSLPGSIARTIDGGKTWTNQTANAPENISDYEGISFVSRTRGWIAATSIMGGSDTGGTIIRTTNRGLTWVSQTLPNAPTHDAPANLADVYFVDNMNGWAVDDWGQILHTSNGGANGPGGWAVQYTSTVIDPGLGSDPPRPYALEAVAFYDVNHGVAVGEAGIIFRTKNGGTTWTQINVTYPPSNDNYEPTLTDVEFPTAKYVAISAEGVGSGESFVLKSTTAGKTFTRQGSGTDAVLNSISFPRGDTDGWASGQGGTLLTNDPQAGDDC